MIHGVIQKVLVRGQRMSNSSGQVYNHGVFFFNETNVDAESLFDALNVFYSFVPDSAQLAACHVHCARVFAVRAATTHVVTIECVRRHACALKFLRLFGRLTRRWTSHSCRNLLFGHRW